MSHRLVIETFTLGEWMTNCYVLHLAEPRGSTEPSPCWVIDAGFAPEPMVQYIQEHRLRPERILLTHAHVDHIAGLDTIRAAWPQVPILIHRAEAEFLTEPVLNLSIVLDEPIIAPAASGTLEHGHRLSLGGLAFEVRHTPGHSPGGVSFYQSDAAVVFAGDTLFAGSIGRTDFPSSNTDELFTSIRGQLLSLPDATRVFCGHGPSTTIGQERLHNPFIRG